MKLPKFNLMGCVALVVIMLIAFFAVDLAIAGQEVCEGDACPQVAESTIYSTGGASSCGSSQYAASESRRLGFFARMRQRQGIFRGRPFQRIFRPRLAAYSCGG